jgi:hypothetical protein
MIPKRGADHIPKPDLDCRPPRLSSGLPDDAPAWMREQLATQEAMMDLISKQERYTDERLRNRERRRCRDG